MILKIIIAAVSISLLILLPCLLPANQATEQQAAQQMTEKLQRCPDKPNCINTEYPDHNKHYLPPLDFTEPEKERIMPLAKRIIQEMGGTIIKESVKASTTDGNQYLAATFTSSLFRFVDDFELRQDNISYQLHIRSASRTGYSDFGVNKRRIMQFSEQFKNQIKASTFRDK